MAGDPGQLGHDDADVLGPLGGLGVVAHQLLDGQGIAEVVAHARQVVEPVGEREVHQERVPLADLLVVAVHVAHDRLEADDRLAVDPQVHPEDAVRAGVLRAHADDELVGVQLADLDARRAAGPCPWCRRRGSSVVPAVVVLGDLDVRAVGVELLGAEVLAGPLDAAVEDLRRPLVVGLEEVLAERVVGVAVPHEDALQLGVAR